MYATRAIELIPYNHVILAALVRGRIGSIEGSVNDTVGNLIMNTNVKLLVIALGLVAVVATPAMAKTHHSHANRSEIGRTIAPATPAGPYGYEPGDHASAQGSNDAYYSLSQGRQPYLNPDRVPSDATTEPF